MLADVAAERLTLGSRTAKTRRDPRSGRYAVTVPALIRHEGALPPGDARAHHGLVTEITQWQDPAARRGIHRFVPGLPEPTRASNTRRTSSRPGDVVERALDDWLDGLTVASTVDAD